MILLSFVQIMFLFSCTSEIKREIDESQRYALLIGGGVTERDHYESYYKNIEYVLGFLKKVGYQDDNIRILFYEGQTPFHPIVDGDATKKNFITELHLLANTIDSNDSLLIFRSGHGKVDLVFDKFVINKNGTLIECIKLVGTITFMRFSDGELSHLEFQKILKHIKAKQIVVILNQCFAGQFVEITKNLNNTVVISETKKGEFAINDLRKKCHVWAFVKCLFDGFLYNNRKGEKQTAHDAFQYMLKCNPYIKGISVQADRPLWKEHPQIKYSSELKKGSVYID